MKITCVSQFTGKKHTMDLPLTEEEYEAGCTAWRDGGLIQNAFPMLNDQQREFLKTGTTAEEWDTL